MGPSAPEMLARSSADLAPTAVGDPRETVFRRALLAPTWQTGHQAPSGDSQPPEASQIGLSSDSETKQSGHFC